MLSSFTNFLLGAMSVSVMVLLIIDSEDCLIHVVMIIISTNYTSNTRTLSEFESELGGM